MFSAYLPLEMVYAFHEVAETWILRRYPASTEIADGAERTRPAGYVESLVSIFRDRSTKGTTQGDPGQRAPQTCTVYTRTRLLTTQVGQPGGPQPCDVLFDPADGSAWQATSSGDWDEARGFAVVLTRCGSRGVPPWV